MLIVDTNYNVTSHIQRFKAASKATDDGAVCFGRYLSEDTSEEKVIKPAEAHAVADAGDCSVFLIFETTAQRTLSGTGGGHQDGMFSLDYAKTIGAPKDAAIYPAVDWDAQSGQLGLIINYFAAFQAALEGYYSLGAYASGYVNRALWSRHLILFRWLTMSGGFLGTREALEAGEYELRQLLDRTIAGLDVDPDATHEANGSFGAFVPFGPLLVDPPTQPPASV